MPHALSNLYAFATGGSLAQTLLWWLLLVALGLAFFPLTATLFSRFYDRGYLFARIIGLVLGGYTSWLLASLPLVPLTRLSVFGVGIVVAALTAWLCSRRVQVGALLVRKWRIFAAEEALFLLALLTWSFVRSLNPELATIEKPMDYGFVNAALQATYLPPRDPWFANLPINYYYFGHYLTSWLTRLSGMDAAYTCNLMLATLFACGASFGYSLASNLLHLAGQFTRRAAIVGGLTAAALMAFGGNLHTLIFWVIPSLAHKLGCATGVGPTAWCEASRFVGYNPPTRDKTITEFPAYSFINADLHAHTLGLPLALTYLALLLALFLEIGQAPTGAGERDPAARPLGAWRLVLAGIMLAALYMTNAWTLPIYLSATVAVLLLAVRPLRLSREAAAIVTPGLLIVLGTLALAILPFQLHVHTPSHGVRLVAYVTPLHQLLVLWGYQAALVVWYWWPRWRAWWHKGREALPELVPADRFVGVLTLGAAFLIAVPELIYLKDIYGLEYARANTMFKFTYEASTILAVCAGYYVVRLAQRSAEPARRRSDILLAVIVAVPLMFGPVALSQAYHFVAPKDYDGLNGLAYIARQAPDEWDAIRWLRAYAPRDATILEAEGDSYSDAGRIAMATALPTPMGWGNHEWIWRGSDKPVVTRRRQVREAYTSADTIKVRRILERYSIDFVIIGEREKEQFADAPAEALRRLAHTVWTSASVEILAVNKAAAAAHSSP
jgi:uncharacterized membrane protein